MRKIITVILILLSTHLFAQDAIYNKGTFQMHDAVRIGCFGDFINDSAMVQNNGIIHFTGDGGSQLIYGNGTFIFDSVVVNNPDHLLIEQEFKVSENITFSIGNLQTNRDSIDIHFVHFLDGSGYDGASDSSFIDGVTAKSGNTVFDFPVGDMDELKPLSISDPDLGTDQFKAFYLNNDPDSIYSTMSIDITCIDHLSRCEYWVLNRTIGVSAVNVGLKYSATSCGVDELCDLLITRWDGTKWLSEGNGGVIGTMSSGTITSGDGCGFCGVPQKVSEFSPFTLASFSPNNPLPITLIDFEVKQTEYSVELIWMTASETNNDFYKIERSIDGVNWRYYSTIDGAGNTSQTNNYQVVDPAPLIGISYYRLSQVDFDGTMKEIGVESVEFSSNSEYRIHPNPASSYLKIFYRDIIPSQISLYNGQGQLMDGIVIVNEVDCIFVELQQIPPGVYYLHLRKEGQLFVEKIIVI